MAYSDFSLTRVVKDISLTHHESPDLFQSLTPMAVPPAMKEWIEEPLPLALGNNTEKARSEMLIAPILLTVRRLLDRHVTLHSGVDFSVDESRGLVGFCDFIMTRSEDMYLVSAPVLMLVEAKNEDFKKGIGQCFAEMIAAREFNEREGEPYDVIWGCVTTGNLWKFVTLRSSTAQIDRAEYHISQIDHVLAILIRILSQSP